MEPGQFKGKAGRYWWESEPWWPEHPDPGPDAPNVMIVVLDDVGFAQLGCFGSDLHTPTFDRLAAGGLRYSNFHTTALCSPTRATVMTGRNHHTCGMGRITELATGYPGYDATIPKAVGFLPEMLTPQGYAAWAVGKWHLTPDHECHQAATRERWPLGRGFERFYGFFDGETHQFHPALVCDNHQLAPPSADGYHLTTDLVDQAIAMVDDLRNVDHRKPFFLWFATGACHSPHQSPAGYLERYRGAFDAGWDVWREHTLARQKELGVIASDTELSPRPDWVPAWDSLSADARRLYARYMEAFAAFLTHTDEQVGRLVDHLDGLGELDNTLLVLLSDNGASSEGGPVGSTNDVRTWNAIGHTVEEAVARIDEIGGPRMHNNYPWGWTVAGNTPFRRWKREVHEGGVADPLIVHWPARIPAAARGAVRRQYVHSIDIAPTVLDAVGVDPPATIGGVEQRPLDGTSFLSTVDDGEANEVRTVQYYEMFGCRALYLDGWKAVTYHEIQFDEPGLDKVAWELYDLGVDPSECHDLAAEHPQRLAEMVERWWVEAARHQVLPIDNRPFSELVFDRPTGAPPRSRYVYRAGTAMVPEGVAANVKNRPHVVTAEIDVPDDGADGVIISQGSYLGGWSFYMVDSRLRYAHNLSGHKHYRVEADAAVPPGPHVVSFAYGPGADGSPTGRLSVDGEVVAERGIPRFTWSRFSLTGAGLTCGWGYPPAVTDDYVAPFPFTGGLTDVVVEVEGEPVVDAMAEALAAIESQ